MLAAGPATRTERKRTTLLGMRPVSQCWIAPKARLYGPRSCGLVCMYRLVACQSQDGRRAHHGGCSLLLCTVGTQRQVQLALAQESEAVEALPHGPHLHRSPPGL